MGFSESLIFAYVDQGLRRDAAFVGVLVTVQGVGGLLGGLCSPTLVRRLGEVGTLAAGVAFFAPAALALAYPDLRLGFAAVLLAGVSLPLTMVGLHTLIQRRTPPRAARPGRRRHPRRWSAGRRRSPSGRVPCWSAFLDYRLLFALVGVATLAAGGYLWRGRHLSAPTGARPPTPPTRPTLPAPRRPAEDADRPELPAPADRSPAVTRCRNTTSGRPGWGGRSSRMNRQIRR